MFKRMKKAVVAATVLGLLFTAFAPIGMVGKAEASSKNTISRVVSITDETTAFTEAPVLKIKNDDESWTTGGYFEVKFPSDFEWPANIAGLVTDTANVATSATRINDSTIGITFTVNNPVEADYIQVELDAVIDSPSTGEAKVKVDPRDSSITGGEYTFATVGEGDTNTTIADTTDFSRQATIEAIKIDELQAGALDGQKQEITLKLPSKFSWVDTDLNDTAAEVISDGAGLTATNGDITFDGRTLKITNLDITSGSARGYIQLDKLVVRADRDAAKGDVVVTVDGDNVTEQDVTIGKYVDYGIEVTVDKQEELIAGRWEDQTTGKIKIEENVAGSLVEGRDMEIILPDWCKVTMDETTSDPAITIKKDTNVTGDVEFAYDGDDQNHLYWKVALDDNSDTTTIEFEMDLSIAANAPTGDIEAEFVGAGIESQKVKIAKVVAPIKVEEQKLADLRIGLQNQKAPNVVIVEGIKSAADADDELYDPVGTDENGWASKKNIVLTLDDYMQFSKVPTVKVLEGDLDIDEDAVKRANDNKELVIPVKAGSIKLSKLEVSGIEITVDRTAPEGKYDISVGGGALVKNYVDGAGIEDPNVFDESDVVEYPYVNVITPAPGETKSTSMFTIDSTTYKVVENGVTVEKTADVAPFIQNGRTMLPLRAVATALGVSDEMIVWNAATRTAIVNKDGKLASVVVGSTVLDVNGMKIVMDSPAVIKNGRLFLPVSYLATALGVSVSWDAATKTVTFAE